MMILQKLLFLPVQLGNINEGKSKTLTVKLSSEPLNAITVSVSSSLPKQASVDKSSISFTATPGPQNWNNTQIITVTGINDGVADGNKMVNINFNLITGDNSGYNNSLDKSVSTNIIDIHVPDSGEFLQFLNKSAPRNISSIVKGTAYYSAIDPGNLRDTFSKFKSFNKLQDSIDAEGNPNVAVYVNDADLGFGRRMYLSVNRKTMGTITRVSSIASCVENYAPPIGISASAQSKIDLAKANNHGVGGGLIAIVCMEYSGSPSTATGVGVTADMLRGRKFVKFFTYKADGSRLSQVNLDGNGDKTQPGVCNICHGGQGNSLLADGTYPLLGDTGGQFLPWDLNTFIYDSSLNNPSATVTRAKLEPVLKRFNQAVLDTYPAPQTFNFIPNVIIPDNTTTFPGLPLSTNFFSIDIPLTVAGVIDPITSLTFSIDTDSIGAPGLSGNNLRNVRFQLFSPTVLRQRVLRTIDIPVTNRSTDLISGYKNIYFSDIASGEISELLTNGIFTGTAYHYRNGEFVLKGNCISTTLSYLDFGCIDANGDWILRVTNVQEALVVDGSQTNRTSGNINALSLHINGIPEQVYLPAPVELIRGWYGGVGADGKLKPNTTFNDLYVPAGWIDPADPTVKDLYLKVIGPTCRACHIQRGVIESNDIDFSTYTKFMKYKSKIKSMVFDKGLMPLAKRTYQDHFWKPGSIQPSLLAKHILGPNVTLIKPGRNIANAGIDRTGDFAVAVGNTVTLNGHASLFTKGFSWTVKDSIGNAVAISGSTTATPSFNVSKVDIYTATLITSGNSASTTETTDVVLIEGANVASNVKPPISFKNQIVGFGTGSIQDSALMVDCSGGNCHSPDSFFTVERRSLISYVPENPQTFTVNQEIEAYRLIKDRVNTFLPLDSKMITKATGAEMHFGTNVFGGSASSVWYANFIPHYILFQRWVLEGAKFN